MKKMITTVLKTMNPMKKMLLLACITGTACCFWSCSWISSPDPYEQLKMPDANVQFYMESQDKKKVVMEVVPQYREELMAKVVNQLQLEDRAALYRKRERVSSFFFAPSYQYDLKVKNNDTAYEREMFVRKRTWLGGYSIYEFDAQKYFTESSWKEVDKKLRTSDDDDVD